MALVIKRDSLRAAPSLGTALAESTFKINYNSEQESADGAPPVVETAAWQIALSQTVIQSRLIPKEKAHFQQTGVYFVPLLLQYMSFLNV